MESMQHIAAIANNFFIEVSLESRKDYAALDAPNPAGDAQDL
jgi:hypothetical protein